MGRNGRKGGHGVVLMSLAGGETTLDYRVIILLAREGATVRLSSQTCFRRLTSTAKRRHAEGAGGCHPKWEEWPSTLHLDRIRESGTLSPLMNLCGARHGRE